MGHSPYHCESHYALLILNLRADGVHIAAGTASATLMPYNRYGDTVEALLTITIAPKDRHSITLALYLEIDTSRGIVYSDDIEVVDCLMEAE